VARFLVLGAKGGLLLLQPSAVEQEELREVSRSWRAQHWGSETKLVIAGKHSHVVHVRVSQKNGLDRCWIKVWGEPIPLTPYPLSLKDAAINKEPNIPVGHEIGRPRNRASGP
jgi:hypothetical protein